MLKNLSSIVALLLLFSCNSPADDQYSSGILRYLKEEHGQSQGQLKEKIYYIISLDACEDCLNLNLPVILETKKELSPILVGLIANKEYVAAIEKIKLKYQCLYDPKGEIYKFQTGFSKPILIAFDRREDIDFLLHVEDTKVDQAADYLGVDHRH